MTPSDLRLNGTVIRFDASVLSRMEPKLFDAAWLLSNKLWQGSTPGRSQAHFFHYAGRDMVLRHFHRGGMIGRVNRDLYLRLGAAKSRSLREFDLLCEMHSQGLPVPAPVAAQYVPLGPFYRADIITQRIAHARTLQDLLAGGPLSAQLWSQIGVQIRRLHDHGVFHSDLNCRNVMVDTQERIWFIDFDKCEKRPAGSWAQANLQRLRRSLEKDARMPTAAHWSPENWAQLLCGYAGGRAPLG